MPATKVQLTGGAFQDSEGNVLANGYLLMKLSQDAVVPSVGNICAGVEIKIQLDSNGNVVAGQYIWGNDVLTPVNTFYRVTGYTAPGQPAWGPNNQQVAGGPTFNTGTWIPNQVISWTPTTTGVTLETEDVLNSSQILLNLKSTDDSVTITDLGGGNIDFATAGSGGPPSAFMIGAGYFSYPTGIAGGQIVQGHADNTVLTCKFVLPFPITISRCTVTQTSAGNSGSHYAFGIYDSAGNRLLSTIFTTNGSSLQFSNAFAPVTLPAGIYYAAQTADSASGYQPAMNCVNSGANVFNYLNYSIPGIAANLAATGCVLPATLGVITPNTGDGTFGLPLWT